MRETENPPVHPEVLRYIEQYRLSAGLEKSSLKVLDWGCGRGRATIWLREAGYDAFGADIDPEAINDGRERCSARSLDGESVLVVIDERGRTRFPDNFFHFVFSDQVFEHVENLEVVLSEIHRVTMPAGGGLHIFPAHRIIMELHLYMPFVHWLPKNRLRKYLIWLFVLLGKEPKLDRLQGCSSREKAEAYFRYSVEQTFYRSYALVRDTFERHNFAVSCVSINNPRLRKLGPLYPLVKVKGIRTILDRLILTFYSVELLTSAKQDQCAGRERVAATG